MKVYAVLTVDTEADHPMYCACISLYETKERAIEVMRNSVRDDVECGLFFEEDVIWSSDGMMCHDRDGRTMYRVEQMSVAE